MEFKGSGPSKENGFAIKIPNTLDSNADNHFDTHRIRTTLTQPHTYLTMNNTNLPTFQSQTPADPAEALNPVANGGEAAQATLNPATQTLEQIDYTMEEEEDAIIPDTPEELSLAATQNPKKRKLDQNSKPQFLKDIDIKLTTIPVITSNPDHTFQFAFPSSEAMEAELKRRKDAKKAREESTEFEGEEAQPYGKETTAPPPRSYAQVTQAQEQTALARFGKDEAEAPPTFVTLAAPIDTNYPQLPSAPHILATTLKEATIYRESNSGFHVQHFDNLTIRDLSTSTAAVKKVLASVFKGDLRLSLPAPLDPSAPLTSPFYVETTSEDAIHKFTELNGGVHCHDGDAIIARKTDAVVSGYIGTIDGLLGYEGRNDLLNNVIRNLAYNNKEMGKWIQSHRSNVDGRYAGDMVIQYICGSIVTKPITLFRPNGLTPKTLQNVYIIRPSIFPNEIKVFEDSFRGLIFQTIHNGCGRFVENPWKACKRCGSVDHPQGLCHFPLREDWTGPISRPTIQKSDDAVNTPAFGSGKTEKPKDRKGSDKKRFKGKKAESSDRTKRARK